MPEEKVKIESKQIIKREKNKFLIVEVDTIKLPKKRELETITLPDGKQQLPCSPGLLSGNVEVTVMDKGDHYEQRIETRMKFSSQYFLRLATTVRQMKQMLEKNNESYEISKKRWEEYEPFVKEAQLINKMLEKEMERATKKTNKEMK